MRIVSAVTSMAAPASRSFSSTASSASACVPVSVALPPAAATAARNVPVSIRSGMMVWVAPPRRGTPSMTMRSVPAPSMRAPIAVRQRARSTISGSRAAFSSVVVPCASVAAIIRFSVPVTVTTSNTKRVPMSRLARALMYPCSRSISAPIAVSPFTCWSTGRRPIAQPPGSETRASPQRASSGPSARIDARIVFTSS